MAYDNVRSYLGTSTIAAQAVTSTASGQVVAGATVTASIPVAEPTFLVSIAGITTSAAAGSSLAGVKYFVVVGTATTTAGHSTAPTGTLAQSSNSSAFGTFTAPVALAGGSTFTLGLVGTATISASTNTLLGVALNPGLAPQYV